MKNSVAKIGKILLIGGGGHCKSVIDVIEQEGKFEIAGIVDNPELLGSSILGYSVIGNDSDLVSLAKTIKYAIVAVGHIKTSSNRIKLFDYASKAGFTFPSIISPNAYVSRHASIGSGTIIMHHALINSGVTIAENCIINSKALIEHDSEVSNHCHISTNAIVNGGVFVGEGSFIGSGVTTRESIKIRKNSFIKAGSIVAESL